MSKPSQAELAQIRANLRSKRKAPAVKKSDGPGNSWTKGQTFGTTAQTFGRKGHFTHEIEFQSHSREMNFAVKERVRAGVAKYAKDEIMPAPAKLPAVDYTLPAVPAVYRNGRWESVA